MSAVSRSIRRLRMIMPSDGALISYAVVFLLADLPIRWIEWRWGGAAPGTMVAPAKWLLIIGSFWMGRRRAAAFHPTARPDYLEWLMRSPWVRGRPLPGGPVFPVPEDLLVMGGIYLLAFTQVGLRPETVLSRYVIGYIVGITPPMFLTAAAPFGYMVVFGLGLAARVWSDSRLTLAVVAVVLPIGLLGLWKTLGTISLRADWSRTKTPMPRINEAGEIESELITSPSACGWPYDQLSPKAVVVKKRPIADRLLLALIVGWLTFCACGLTEWPDSRRMIVLAVFTFVLGLCGPARYLIYRNGFAPPISFMGRIMTFRWIIPGYDKIAIAPLLTMAAMGVTVFETNRMRLELEYALPIAIAVGLLVALNTGPSYSAWRLTGRSRMLVRFNKDSNEYVTTS